MKRLIVGAVVGICGMMSLANCQAQTTTEIYSPTGSGSYARADTIVGCGTLHPTAVGSTIDFMLGNPVLGFISDPNLATIDFVTLDAGALLGNPGQNIFWFDLMSPQNVGWTPSPIITWINLLGFPFALQSPDHYFVLIRNPGGLLIFTGPHLVF